MLNQGLIIADGRPRDELSPENLHRLYRVRVSAAQIGTTDVAYVPTELLSRGEG
jgi:ABC-type hemin transport system ATPase subunit